jgi:hypothetical protein
VTCTCATSGSSGRAGTPRPGLCSSGSGSTANGVDKVLVDPGMGRAASMSASERPRSLADRAHYVWANETDRVRYWWTDHVGLIATTTDGLGRRETQMFPHQAGNAPLSRALRRAAG